MHEEPTSCRGVQPRLRDTLDHFLTRWLVILIATGISVLGVLAWGMR